MLSCLRFNKVMGVRATKKMPRARNTLYVHKNLMLAVCEISAVVEMAFYHVRFRISCLNEHPATANRKEE